MWDHDLRFLSIAREDIEDLTLQDVKEAVMAQMTTDATEVRSALRVWGRRSHI